MIRTFALYLFVAFFCVYAWKDWYKSTLALIALMAVYQHPDFPTNIAGIQGANPWNLLLANNMAAWLAGRHRDQLVFDLDAKTNALLQIYLLVIVISFLRLAQHYGAIVDHYIARAADPPGMFALVSEHIINAIKFVIPGIMIYDGARQRDQLVMGLLAVCLVYFLLAVQVIRWMPMSTITSGNELSDRALKILSNEVGYHRVNMAMMLSGAFWLLIATSTYFSMIKRKLLVGAALVCFLGLMLTGGRTGYATWAAVGLFLAVVKWRKYLLLAPIFVLIAYMIVPQAFDRLTTGFDSDPYAAEYNELREQSIYLGIDLYEVTSGRNIAWPFVIDKIFEAPWFGYGKEAMITTGLTEMLWTTWQESFPHPHNLYLQIIMDNGFVLGLPVLLLFLTIYARAIKLLCRQEPLAVAIGGGCVAMLTAFFIAGFGSQTFYPREGAAPFWALFGLVLRLYRDRDALFDAESSPESRGAASRGTARGRRSRRDPYTGRPLPETGPSAAP